MCCRLSIMCLQCAVCLVCYTLSYVFSVQQMQYVMLYAYCAKHSLCGAFSVLNLWCAKELLGVLNSYYAVPEVC